MVDVHFDNQILRLTSIRCDGQTLIKTVLKTHGGICLDLEKHKKTIFHHHFACLLKNSNSNHERLIEDFEYLDAILDGSSKSSYIQIVECPLKYEFFRRPQIILKRGVAFQAGKDYSLNNHDNFIQVLIYFLVLQKRDQWLLRHF
jgi:hypothetical protein